MRPIFLAAALLAAGPAFAQAPAAAPAGTYLSDPPHTSLTWRALHNSLSWYTARFTNVSITLDFNPTDATKSKVSATIDPKSVETDYLKTRPAGNTEDFNNELITNERFLNAAKFPKITFVSTSVSKSSETTGKVTGNLTLGGVTKPVTLDITYNGHRNDPRLQKHRVGFQATGSFKRSDFGMPTLGFLGDEIRVEINSELIQK